MSSKWRAIQHRHRYTYNSVVFPKQFVEALDAMTLEAFAAWDFFPQLKRFVDLSSTYAQVAAVKELASAFGRLVASASEPPDGNASVAVRLYLEILFLENSLPLHRILISALAKSRRFLPLIDSCFVSLCEEYGGGSNSAKKGKKAFLVSRAALSVISYPKMDYLKETLERCADLAAMDVVAGLGTVVSDLNDGLRPSPVIMEQCQEALSCLYYLLQRYPATFGSSEAEEGNSSTFRSIIRTVLSVLKSPAFSRDCLVAAGVSFCSALQICMAPSELSSFISRGLFGFSSYDSDTDHLDAKKILSDCEIYATIQELSTLSRLCLLRGILTAIPRNVLNMCLTQTSNESFWTILYDGILPDLCKYCENPVDSHFNFHALTVTQICLQQIKTSIVAGVTDFSADYHPFTEGTMGRILKIIWNNLEDPLSQTVKQVHLIFDLLLDIEFSLPSVEGYDRGKQFLHKIAKDLLCLGYRCKGRYVPLASITKRLGAKTMLSFNAKLLYETAYAYIDDDVCCAVTSFLKCFFECLRDECWSSDGVEKGYDNFRDLCLPPLLQGLVSGHSKLRSNLNTYALPLILEIDTDSIFPMLAYIYIGPNIGESVPADLKIEHCVAALVSLIKVSRILALIEGDIDFESDTLPQKKSPDSFAFVRIKGINVRVPVEWIVLALKHADDSLRIDAAESLFLNPKTSSLPSSLELSLMKVAVPLNMRCTSTAFQMKWTSLFRKFFSRVRTALERQVKQHSWNPDACLNGTEDSILDHSRDLTFYRTKELFQFMKWLSCYLFNSCYPSAPYERKTMAMELILVMIEVWPIILPQGNHYIYPYTEEITSPDSTLALVGSIIDSWDRLRENSFRILLSFPTPLPGISTGGSLNALIRWAKKLVCSPRVRESDAGALTLRLIFKKYVVGLGWVFDSSANGGCCSSQNKQINGNLGIHEFRVPTVYYISSLIEWLSIVVEEGERDLSQACSKSFVHGVLLTLRYTFEELDWSSYVVQSSILEMRRLIEKLLGLITRITSLALWVVSADIWSMPYDMEDAVDDSTFLTDTPVEQNIPDLDQGDRIMTSDDSLKPAEHVVMVGCWLAMKEVSLLLATVIQKIPLPSCTFPDLSKHGDSDRDNDGIEISTMSESVLDLVQLENIGNHFLQVLLKMKHNGAIDKTRAGFTALCNRLLCSNDPRLCKMTDSWMEQLMERTTAKGQTVDDLLRRSAGIPAAFLALFLSEPEGTPKKLLPKTLRWLIDVASSSLSNNNKDSDISNEAVYEEVLTNSEMLVALHKKGQNSKIRDEGVVPTVHAFNVLRVAFDDTNLATDTSGFCAEAMIISIRSFSSSYWEVRNSACLAYTALVRRMIGFLNTQRRESVRRALTGLEFFHRYPALHPFLFSELKIATELFGDGCSRHMETNMEKVIHPSLCPILILLTRLKPSLVSHRADDSLDPFLLTPFIRKCATQSNLRLRVLASRALTGLVSNEKLQNVIREAAHGLPCQRNHITDQICDRFTRTANPVSFNYIHGVLLQLASLLDNNCRQLPDILKKDQILGELIHVLLSRSWIGSSRSCTCPTLNSSYLRVLDLMLDISRTYTMSKHTETIQGLLLGLASECLGADKSNGLIFHDPTTVELHKQAVISYFNCLLEGDPEGSQEGIQLLKLTSPISKLSKLPKNKVSLSQLEETILSCIHDPTYEVRIATLKKLLQLVRSMIPGECGSVMCLWAKSHLHRLLIKLLSKEENPKCMYYILKIIFNWDLMQLETPSDSFSDFLYPFWDRLVDLTSSVKHAKTKEISLCCMGVCVKKFVEFHMSYVLAACQIDEESAKSSNSAYLTKSWSKAFKSIDHFINLIKCHSAPSEPVSIRRAAAQAIIASGLLKEVLSVAPFVSKGFQTVEEHDINIEEIITRSALTEVINVYACRILDLWFTCIQLLEDEDVVLREKLAKDVQNCISSRRPNSSFTDATPTQVDRMIQSSFDFLSSTFGNWVGYLNYLSKCVILTASSTSTYGDLVRQIFDKEIDNHHEEKLLICQICCLHLKELTDSNYWAAGVDNQTFGESNIQTFSWSCRMKFLYQLTSFTSSLLEIDGKADWIGGIGNHKDAFVPVYANLLGLYALSHGASPDGSKDKDKYLCEFMELGGVIRPFLRNPLISNLYHQVLQLHQSILSSQAHKSQVLDCPSRDTRDPFFLLR